MENEEDNVKYDYKCDACENQFEVNQSMKEEARATCPKCGSETRNRLITGGSGFLLQGGGWYADGYGNKK
jgi:putative FmdB family regulatory protein